MLVNIVVTFNNALAFLQDVAVKSLQIIADPLLLHADECARVWFCQWSGNNLPPLTNAPPQDHTGLTGSLSNVLARLQKSESLHPVIAAQREADKKTKGWDSLSATAQQVILAASASNRTYIPTSPSPTIHQFLNAKNATNLQADCALTYAGHNI